MTVRLHLDCEVTVKVQSKWWNQKVWLRRCLKNKLEEDWSRLAGPEDVEGKAEGIRKKEYCRQKELSHKTA